MSRGARWIPSVSGNVIGASCAECEHFEPGQIPPRWCWRCEEEKDFGSDGLIDERKAKRAERKLNKGKK